MHLRDECSESARHILSIQNEKTESLADVGQASGVEQDAWAMYVKPTVVGGVDTDFGSHAD